jgi:Zn-dependent protease with chaperone function
VCLAAGEIPIKLLVLGAFVVFGSLWAIGKSLFVRAREPAPGDKLDLDENTKLRAALDEVASIIGTRSVDSVYMTPGAEVAVFERGGMLRQLRGHGERCLVVGAAVLEGLRVREFKSILAHEYGHFRNADTAGGGFALAVRRSLMTMAIHMARSGAATFVNPAWWFVHGFYSIFVRVSQGASRLQEVLADRWAAFAYGSDAFVAGLRHVIDRSVRFDAHLSATLNEVVPKKVALANVYAFVPSSPVPSAEIEDAVEKLMNRPALASDSHPRPADRIAWVTRLAAPARQDESVNDSLEAWSLFADRAVLEERMTLVVRERVVIRKVRVGAP